MISKEKIYLGNNIQTTLTCNLFYCAFADELNVKLW